LPVNGVRYGRCIICLEHGQMAEALCCSMPRHTACEKRNLARNAGLITVRDDGLVSLPCSSCRQTWRAVPFDDVFVVALLQRLGALPVTPVHPTVSDPEIEIPGAAPAAAPARPSITARDVLLDAFASRRRAARAAATLILATFVASLVAITIPQASRLIVSGNAAAIAALIVLGGATGLGVFIAHAYLRLRRQRRRLAEAAAEAAGEAVEEMPAWARTVARRHFLRRLTGF
jgi:hypothetical protein